MNRYSPTTSALARLVTRRALAGALVASALATGLPVASELVHPVVGAARAADDGPLDGTWTTIANGDRINDILRDGDVAWAATDGGGLVRWDLTDGSYTQLLGPQDGLLSNNVADVERTPDGSLWLATDLALTRFDPETGRVTNYTPEDTPNMPARIVTALAARDDGMLWVGFSQEWDPELENERARPVGGQKPLGAFRRGGLSLFDPAAEAFDPAQDFHAVLVVSPVETHYESLPSENVTALAIGSDGLLWVGTRTYFVYERTTCSGDVCPPEDGYWVADGGGLAATDGATWQRWMRDAGASCLSNHITDLAADVDGRVWVATWGQGLLVMRDGLAATRCGGGNPVYYRRQRSGYDGLRGNVVWAVDVDDDGRVWVGHGDGVEEGLGIAILDHRGTFVDAYFPWSSDDRWEFLDIDGLAGASRDIVTALAVRGPEPRLIGTRDDFNGEGSGLRAYRTDDSWTAHRTADNGLPSNQIGSIAVHPQSGDIWVATAGRGTAHFDGERWQSWRPFAPGGEVATLRIDAPSGRSVLPVSFEELETCRAAMGEAGTIVRLGDDPTRYRFRRCRDQGGIAIELRPDLAFLARAGTVVSVEVRGPASDVATAIAFDAEGTPWVGGRKTIWESGPTLGSHCSTFPDCWLDGGVARWTGEGWELFNKQGTWSEVDQRGLPDNDVQAVAIGPDDRIWLGTGHPRRAVGWGIAIYDPEQGSWANFSKQSVGTEFGGDGVADFSFDPVAGAMWVAHHAATTCVEQGPFGGGCTPRRLGGGVSRFDGSWSAWSKGHRPPATMRVFGDEGEFSVIQVDRARGRVWAGGYDTGSNAFHWHLGQDIDATLNWCPLDCTADAWQAISWPDDGEVAAIELDGDGNLWVGTHRSGNGVVPPVAGVKLLNADGQWFTYTPANSGLPSNEITALTAEGDDRMWVGTRTKGLSLYSEVIPPTPTPTPTATATATTELTPTPVESTPTPPPTATREVTGTGFEPIYLPFLLQIAID